MDELFFVGTDIVKETKHLVDCTTITCTGGMAENELDAYRLGIKNTLEALKGVLYVDTSNEFVININGMDIPTEFTIDDLETYFLDT